MDVTVVGAGIGGLAFAGALRAAGVPCRVFERLDRWPDTAAGIQLAPNAVRPALRLGLGPALAEHAVAIEGMEFRSWRGRPLAWTPLGTRCEELYGAPYYTVHRADLHEALIALAGPDTVRADRPVTAVAHDADHGEVILDDGSRHRSDVVVCADGVHSVVRTHLTDDAPVHTGLVALRALVETAELPPDARSPRVRVWFGPGAHVVCYPVSAGRRLSLTAVFARGREAELAALRDWHAPVAMLAAAAEVVHRAPLCDRDPLERWVRGRVTVLGDAAHAMLPFLAQGACQAVEDATELAARLTDAPAAAVPERLARYAAARAGRTAALVRAGREQSQVSHLPDGARQRDRDAVLRRGAGLSDRGWLYGPVTAG